MLKVIKFTENFHKYAQKNRKILPNVIYINYIQFIVYFLKYFFLKKFISLVKVIRVQFLPFFLFMYHFNMRFMSLSLKNIQLFSSCQFFYCIATWKIGKIGKNFVLYLRNFFWMLKILNLSFLYVTLLKYLMWMYLNGISERIILCGKGSKSTNH